MNRLKTLIIALLVVALTTGYFDSSAKEVSIGSQARSGDPGKAWECGWPMYFTSPPLKATFAGDTAGKGLVGVLELRNYIIKEGARDRFISFFEANLVKPQIDAHALMLGQYRVKGSEDNFFWVRAFGNMKERSSFLHSFYYGALWKQFRQTANSMLANNDNVHLLRPMEWRGDTIVGVAGLNKRQLVPKQGIAVVEFYTANQKLPLLLGLFSKNYLPLLKKAGVNDFTLWTSVREENDFPQLPVFQDKNLLVTITFFKDELAFIETIKKVSSNMPEEVKAALRDAITIKETMILYPTERSNEFNK
jgi:hypothetical protein